MVQRSSIISFFLFLLLALSACYSSNVKTDEIVEDGLIINSISIGLGGKEDLDTTVVSYNFNLWNRTGKSVIIKSVEPILNTNLQKRLIESNVKQDINKQLKGNTSEAFSGTFELNTTGLNKEQIMDLEINVKEFNISTEQVIEIKTVNN